MVCSAILRPIVVIIRTVIAVVREVVETVCEWVSKVITTTKEVVEEVCKQVREKVCKWLPWPLNKVCDWTTKTVCQTVTKILEITETVWEWVCREVIHRIIDWIEVIFEYVIYIVKWVCWVIDWVFRLPDLLFCAIGARPQRFITVCAKILADNAGNPAVPVTDVENMLRDSARILRDCNITLVVCGVEVVRKPEYLNSTTCEGGGMFRRFFTWFSNNSCGCCTTVTVYVVNNIQGARGCAYPGTDWVTVDAAGDGSTVVQEIGHLADLWGHSDDPDNVMSNQPGGTRDQVTSGQCCMFRTARFARALPGCHHLMRTPISETSGIVHEKTGPTHGNDEFRP